MKTYYNVNRNYTGTFLVNGEEFRGELVYNRESGKIALNLVKELHLNMVRNDDSESYTSKELRKEYHQLEVIPGKLDEGNPIVLFTCRCTQNTIAADFGGRRSRNLKFHAEYMVWNDADATDRKYSKLILILENALQWSQLTQIDSCDGEILKFSPRKKWRCFDWFGAKITFGTYLDYDTFSQFQENTQIIERLAVAIQVDEDKDIGFFLDVRNKLMAMISYGIKDNLNIVRQYLSQRDDVVAYPENSKNKPVDTEYRKYDLLTNEPYHVVEQKSADQYNFTLPQLPKDKNLPKKLELITPVFNLYLSLFKYRDMPVEMVFLNMIQALETFHARFYFGEERGVAFQDALFSKYKEIEGNPTPPEYYIDGKLIPEFVFGGEYDKKKRKPNLIPRIRHMLVSAEDQLLREFCKDGGKVVHQIVYTRNYFTHYGEGKEHRAATGKNLESLTEFVAFVLEYHIHVQLGIELDKTPIILDGDESKTDYCDYAQYMRKLIEKRDYFASVLPIDLSRE